MKNKWGEPAGLLPQDDFPTTVSSKGGMAPHSLAKEEHAERMRSRMEESYGSILPAGNTVGNTMPIPLGSP